MNATETVNTAAHVEVKSDERKRYEEARRNYRCCRRDLINQDLTKLKFHARGLLRALFGRSLHP